MNKTAIAVVGGGAVGRALACDCALAGCTDVRLYARSAFKGLSPARAREEKLTIYGPQKNRARFRRDGSARPALVSTDLPEALRGAEIVLIALPASAHPAVFQELIPCLEDGMILHILPDNFGALRLRHMMRKAGCGKKVIIGGWNCPPIGARLDGREGEAAWSVRMVNRFINLTGAAFPYTDQKDFLGSVERIPAFDCAALYGRIRSGDTILDADFSNLNTVLHIPATILGVGVMENWGTVFGADKKEFSIFCHAMCPSIAHVQKQFYDEEIAVAEALGIQISRFPEESFYNRESVLADTYLAREEYASFEDPCRHQIGIGPPSIHHRFITEDVPIGAGAIHRLGVLSGTPTPIIDAFITLAGALTDRDYYREGLSLEEIGLGDVPLSGLRRYLERGTLPDAKEGL